MTDTATPADAAEVADVVRRAADDRAPVYPLGGGTALDYGGRPSVLGVGLSLARLNRVVDYPADDMTITVEAGITMADLAERLLAKRQRLPLDVPHADRATLGGVVAANPAGPRRYACGTIRDYLIGVRAVDGTGMEFGGGGRVVKNAAGYDTCKLMIGAMGTLGVITQATLMVRPVVEASAILVGEVPDFDAAERVLAAAVHTQTRPVAIELMAGENQPPRGVLGPVLQGNIARLMVGFEGSSEEVDWMVEQLGREWAEAGIGDPITLDGDDVPLMWQWLTELPADVQIHLRPSGVAAMAEQLLARWEGCWAAAHAGSGVIRMGWPALQLPAKEVLCGELRVRASEAGGNVTVLAHRDDEQLSAADVFGPPGDASNIIRALKDRFDPHGILNPGRLAFD